MSQREDEFERYYGKKKSSKLSELPELYSVYRGEIAKIMPFGCFVKMKGIYQNGLVHISQICNERVDNIHDLLSEGDKVVVKVITIDGNKIGLSMKYVDQSSEKDLDPNNIKLEMNQKPKSNFQRIEKRKLKLEAVLENVCSRCGSTGHLSFECYSSSNQGNENEESSKKYELISQDEIDELKNKNSHKDSKKKKKKKKKSKSLDLSIEEAIRILEEEKRRKKKKKKKKKKKHNHHKHHKRKREYSDSDSDNDNDRYHHRSKSSRRHYESDGEEDYYPKRKKRKLAN
eukprot:TRINITY_DN45_c0_g1_i4.p1 TRINITY_DN45_c0_g1~~TRINITY_DN45_c0_g1_i4.p1  ORF type:complete len:287 (-),score=88.53 TRINITY_DN45_c0_g1_i4:159-1019(-)